MLFELVNCDQQHVVADLQCNENSLSWRVSGCENFLIVRTKFGQRVSINELIDSIQNLPISYPFNGQEMQVREGVFIAGISMSLFPSYTISVKPAAYAVYSVEFNQSERKATIYSPLNENSYYCNVPSNVTLTYSYKEGERKFLRKKESNRYVINIPLIPGYEGGLSYSFDNKLFYPITKDMLGKTIYIDSETEEKIYLTSNEVGGFVVNLERKSI